MQTQNMYELAEQLKQLREKSHRQSISFLCKWQKQKPRISPVPERCFL